MLYEIFSEPPRSKTMTSTIDPRPLCVKCARPYKGLRRGLCHKCYMFAWREGTLNTVAPLIPRVIKPSTKANNNTRIRAASQQEAKRAAETAIEHFSEQKVRDRRVAAVLNLTSSVPEDVDWQNTALCAQADPELFFPEKGQSTMPAKIICRQCEVRLQCLDHALSHQEGYGVWGGLNEQERRIEQRKRQRSRTKYLLKGNTASAPKRL